MARYMVVRSFDVGEEEMPTVGRRSREIVDTEFPEITWEHSHVVVDDAGKVRTFCVYAAALLRTATARGAPLGLRRPRLRAQYASNL